MVTDKCQVGGFEFSVFPGRYFAQKNEVMLSLGSRFSGEGIGLIMPVRVTK